MEMWWFGVREFLAAVTGVPGGLALEIDGELVEIGVPGQESVTHPHGTGLTIYADLDGDGVVDHVTVHDYAGGYEVWSRQATPSDWGLPTGAPANPSTLWGLESEDTPGRGQEMTSNDHMNSGWICIDRG